MDLKQRNILRSLPLRALSDEGRVALLDELKSERRRSMAVQVQTTMCLQRFINAGMMKTSEHFEMKELVEELKHRSGVTQRLRVCFMNATEHGGGVAEMRLDTVALMRDLGTHATWLVMDGARLFYKVTVHIHEGLQNPFHEPLRQHDIETYHLTTIANFLRMEQERKPDEMDIFWVDDPQPLGLGLLMKALYPRVRVIWRCHVHVDAEASVKAFVKDLLYGRLHPSRDFVLLEFLKTRKYDGQIPSLNCCVFHRRVFAENLGVCLGEIPIHVMPPCINPLSFKNMEVNDQLIEATLVKYGIMQPRRGRTAKIPPYVLQVSRFDPYKGPLELITAFTEAAKKLPEEVQREIRLLLVSSIPGDNKKGQRLARLLQEFVDSLDLSDFPMESQAAGPYDLRKRIFLLTLDDKAPWERLCATVAREGGYCSDRMVGIAREAEELGGLSSKHILESLEYSGLVSPEVAAKVSALAEADGVRFTSEQKVAVLDALAVARARRNPGGTAVTLRRATNDSFTGKEINAFEVNAIQSGALVSVQFSSKEGFGLTVSESLVKAVKGYEGTMVATLVGGITDQAEVCEMLTIAYPEEEAAASLEVYNNLPEHPEKCFWVNQFEKIRARSTVQKLEEHLRNAITMPEAEHARIRNSARPAVLQHFSPWANLRNILEGLVVGVRERGKQGVSASSDDDGSTTASS